MDRVHAIEFEDFQWVPSAVRDGGTALLDLGFAVLRFYRPVASAMVSVLDATGATHAVDVCSGAGGGALAMRRELKELGRALPRWTLTDRYPNEGAIAQIQQQNDSSLEYKPTSVDAMSADDPAFAKSASSPSPPVRTMFGALHHFRPAAVRSILAAAVSARAPVAFFDIAASPQLRKVPLVLAPIPVAINMTMLFWVSFLMVPFARPFRLSRLALTYLIPLIPMLVAWDGTASALRAYMPEELLEIARSVPGSDSYEWRSAREGNALYLTGIPK
ncbi:MAG: hypothetical protein JNK05_28450 [Myxococcales bacterium]|nr:hypothetical protein [Myxococcales bacterium]